MQSSEIQQALLAWYDRHARDLPWRRTKDPYRIWLSEIMLQQTQVNTVIPYYERWLKRFPDVHALARAEIDMVLKLWEGLGYYNRARNLQAAAREVVRHHKGIIPSNRDALLALPGIGRYTVGAILSIAFDQPAPLVDGNVARVFARLLGIKVNVKSGPGNERIWRIAASMVPANRPGDFNQSLMELGATVCLPSQPLCSECPLRKDCVALAKGLVEKLPNLGRRPASRLVRRRALLIWRADRVLIHRRAEGSLLGGFWEFPETAPAGIDWKQNKTLEVVRHSVMNDRIVTEPVQGAWVSGTKEAPDWKWATRSELHRLHFIGAHRKIIAMIG